MTIRPATAEDWPEIWPLFNQIVQAGETYAYATDLTSEQARDLWLMQPLGQTVVGNTGWSVSTWCT